MLNKILLTLFLVAGSNVHAEGLTSAQLSRPLVTMNQDSQKTINISMYKGKVVLIDFWASWCIPCRASFPFYQSLHDKYASDGLVIIAVNGEDDLNAAQQFLSAYNPTFLVVRDEGNGLANSFQLPKMPTSYLVDRKGNMTSHPGFMPGDDAVIEAQVKAALGK